MLHHNSCIDFGVQKTGIRSNPTPSLEAVIPYTVLHVHINIEPYIHMHLNVISLCYRVNIVQNDESNRTLI